ncbi:MULTISPECIES: hypothetical protein [Roseobacteraceae]|uniref:Transcriptional regulator n=1 Tax=Pseudosulfitobacter pseudonitzschiae TaxID=1402135 RepID=A0A221K6H7_9RHOB|nr:MULTISPECIES: hypothetical protein [Roseobacteraceae]ASM74480.1 hypothetical protein SULPSESMR1_04784 [Pseudosulfitobacter pseudonitzschiae]
MLKLTKSTVFTTAAARPETPIDKTTRAATEIIDGETKEREVKTARLRQSRLEKEAIASVKPAEPTPKAKRKKPQGKTTK